MFDFVFHPFTGAPVISSQINNYNQRQNITNSTYQFDLDFAIKVLTFD